MMAGCDVIVPVRVERRLDRLADLGRVPAAGVKTAAGRRRDRTRDVAPEHDSVPARQGVDPSLAKGGLVNLAERAAARNGTFELFPGTPRGPLLRWSVPR